MKKRVFSAIIGLLLLAGCAVYIAVTAFGVTDIFSTTLRGWWAIFLIIPGILGLFQKGSRMGSAGLLLLGIGLFCNAQEWFGLFDPTPDIKWWQMALAIIMLLAGLGFIRLAFVKKKNYIPGHVSIDGDTINISTEGGKIRKSSCTDEHSSVFSDQTVSYSGREFKGIEISGVFGNAVLDLRGAIINEDCTVEANSIFGSVEIYTSDDANFKVVKNSVFGTVSDAPDVIDASLPTVTVVCNSIFGSVEFKS